MMRRYLVLCSGLLMLTVAGCMQTRHVETSSVTNMSGGSCAAAGHDGTFSERKWCGPWFTQPAKAQP